PAPAVLQQAAAASRTAANRLHDVNMAQSSESRYFAETTIQLVDEPDGHGDCVGRKKSAPPVFEVRWLDTALDLWISGCGRIAALIQTAKHPKRCRATALQKRAANGRANFTARRYTTRYSATRREGEAHEYPGQSERRRPAGAGAGQRPARARAPVRAVPQLPRRPRPRPSRELAAGEG